MRIQKNDPAGAILVAVWILGFLLSPALLKAQNSAGLMYGKIYTQTNQYEGLIRWGKEETMWLDYFNASKKSQDQYKQFQQNNDNVQISFFDLNWDLSSIWTDATETAHQFNCQFGDIKVFKVTGSKNARIRLKNGWEIDVLGYEYNDLGEKIQVYDKDLGLMNIEWNRIDKVEFSQAPKKTPNLGEVLYGVVETNRREKFSGFILWDHDERLGTDKLDGNTRDGNVSLAFSDIKSIERKPGQGCQVVLQSGKELFMTGTNDVHNGNRGVVVHIPGKGTIEVPWNAFKRADFQNSTEAPAYDQFPTPKTLTGKVFTIEDKEIAGTLVYDFDESLDLETLEGTDNGIKYTIPFRNIRSIRPRNEEYSVVELRNGESLLLGGGHDVGSENDGVLVFQKGKKEPIHIPRKKIDQIVFD